MARHGRPRAPAPVLPEELLERALLAGGLMLERHEPARNAHRRYRVRLQPTLGGELDLVCEWGRVGSRELRPGSLGELHPDLWSAREGLRRVAQAKMARGYRLRS